MTYRIEYSKQAEKFIKAQPSSAQKRIVAAIHKLPFEGDIKALAGLSGYYRLRVGDYRIIYRIEQERLIVWIDRAGNRGDVYKKR